MSEKYQLSNFVRLSFALKDQVDNFIHDDQIQEKISKLEMLLSQNQLFQ